MNETRTAEFANVVWLRRVEQHARQFGCDFTTAWKSEAGMSKNLYTLMMALGANPQQIQFANERERIPKDPPWAQLAAEEVGKRAVAPLNTGESIQSIRSKFHAAVARYQTDTGLNYNAAFNAVLAQDEFARLRESPVTSAPVSVDLTANPKIYIAVARRSTALHFLLPETTDPEEVLVAYEANGRRINPVHFGKIFNALVGFWQKRRGVDFEQAIGLAKEKYSRLWQATWDLGTNG